MLDHMVECSELHRSTGEQGKSVKGNWYYRILQMEKGKRDASSAIVTATADCATGDCARLCNERYYCMTGKEKNTTNCAYNT